MYDRIPSPGKENRVSITQDNGQVITGVLAYADDATQEGSAYTKGNVLPDDVCTAYGIDTETSEPKDAFLAIPGIMGKCFLLITVKKINGAPYPGVVVNGLTGIDTPRRTTNQNGQVAVYVDAGTYDLTFAPNPVCVDTTIPGKSVTLTAGGTGSVTTQEQSKGLTSLTIRSSRTVAFSANVRNLDAFCVGGGGSGGTARNSTHAGNYMYSAAGGGAGGGVVTRKGVSFSPYAANSAVIGAGGPGNTYGGGYGGTTSFLGVSASGGAPGGSTNGWVDTSTATGATATWSDIKGASGTSGGGGPSFNYGGDGGSNGSSGEAGRASYQGDYYNNGGSGYGGPTTAFGESGGTKFAAGGGGGAIQYEADGGADGGGTGAFIGRATSDKAVAGGNATANTGSGGGGGAVYGVQGPAPGGNGGSGIIMLRWVNAS